MKRHLLQLALLAVLVVSTPIAAASAEAPPPFAVRWGTAGSGPGQFDNPFGIAIAPGGDVFVVDQRNHRVQRFTNDGAYRGMFGGLGSGSGTLRAPSGIAIDAAGTIYVSDYGNGLIQVFDSNTNFVRQWSAGARTLALDPTGQHLYATNVDSIYEYSPADGRRIRAWQFMPRPIFGVFSFGVGPSGTIYKTTNLIGLFDPTGLPIGIWSSQGTDDGQFNVAAALAVDTHENVYATDWMGLFIQKFSPAGAFLTKWVSTASGDGQFSETVQNMAVDSEGNVFIVDSRQNQVTKFGLRAPVETRKATWGKLKTMYRR